MNVASENQSRQSDGLAFLKLYSMGKDDSINLKVSGELKRKVMARARSQGLTLPDYTRYLLISDVVGSEEKQKSS